MGTPPQSQADTPEGWEPVLDADDGCGRAPSRVSQGAGIPSLPAVRLGQRATARVIMRTAQPGASYRGCRALSETATLSFNLTAIPNNSPTPLAPRFSNRLALEILRL
jgi:hypothetical protein